MLRYIRSVMNPSAYHGHGKNGPFFEGWYYKLIDPGAEQRWCIIPGVYLGKRAEDTHAFIQVMDGVTGKSIYQPYGYEHFHAAEGKFEVRIAESRFWTEGLQVQIDHPEMEIRGELAFEGITPWQVTVASPGIMGWYAWVPVMECYHGVVSLDHTIRGMLEINGKQVDFSGGMGYIEKDWGQSFPKAWVWMQTNHFAQPHVSLTASAAIIPWRRTTFNGFIAGLWLEGKLHRFATYTGAKLMEYEVSEHAARLVFISRSERLDLTAFRADGGVLQAPTTAQMDRRITETLNAEVEVRLAERKGEQWLVRYAGKGKYAGLEVMGRLEGI